MNTPREQVEYHRVLNCKSVTTFAISIERKDTVLEADMSPSTKIAELYYVNMTAADL